MILYIPLTTPNSATHNAVDYGIPVAGSVATEVASNLARYRERDFGIGYGSSSGYASNRSYANHSAQPYFRCG